MTREEAIRALERADDYVGIHYINGVEEAYINPHLREAVKVALSSLRPVSREQVDVVINSLKLRLENKVITNADRIRAMSDEELAKWLEYEGGGACAEVCGWLDWLQQPAEEDT